MARTASTLDDMTLLEGQAVTEVLTLMAIALREDDLESAKHYEHLALNMLRRAELQTRKYDDAKASAR
jgi:hypothetical protein